MNVKSILSDTDFLNYYNITSGNNVHGGKTTVYGSDFNNGIHFEMSDILKSILSTRV